ncbi:MULTISPECIES: SPW repeat domain-containing protein [unclassified Rhodococcus (in: high G+C Gram-positive bacteria)]|uniref:SPW repeat domain-containing protein n=1 Tax=Rhodococcus sp. SJ-3 TaxID=3454628 RepID=UPI002D83F275|nr:SPW repeat protein [Rhodococcus sp. (in: high G+C Gram-positive bacteria)]
MFSDSRLQDYVAVVLGVFAALSPLWLDTNSNAMWSLIVLGVLVALCGIAQIMSPATAAIDYAMGIFGALLFISPWVMSYTAFSGASWTAWVVGVLTVVVAVAALPAMNTRMHGGRLATHH